MFFACHLQGRDSKGKEQLRDQLRILRENVPVIDEGDKYLDWQRAVRDLESEIRAEEVADATDNVRASVKTANE